MIITYHQQLNIIINYQFSLISIVNNSTQLFPDLLNKFNFLQKNTSTNKDFRNFNF